MSSKKLMAEQVERWFKSRQQKSKTAAVDVEGLKKEVEKLQSQVERYNKGYGAGAFTLEQLKGYTIPVKDKISQLEIQIASASKEASQTGLQMPSQAQMAVFAEKAKKTLHDLKFPAQRAIVLNVVEKIIGARDHLQVIGNIPLNSNVGFITYNRHCGFAKCRQKHPV